MNFDVKAYAVIEIFGTEVAWLTQTVISSWIVMAVLICFAVFARIKINKKLHAYDTEGSLEEAPKGFQNVIEMLIEMFDNFVRNAAGEKLHFLGGWFFMVFSFILISNLSGLIPMMRPPTADWTVTVTLALCTFVLIQAMALRFKTKEYLKSFIEPFFIFLPLNVIGELARPVSLSFRLFGNILAGMILMSLIYELTPIYVKIAIPSFLHAYFDVAMGALQAFIFSILSLSFIGTTAGTSGEQ